MDSLVLLLIECPRFNRRPLIINHPSQAWIRAYWWVALHVRWLQQLDFSSLSPLFVADFAVAPQVKAHRPFSNCRSQEKQMSVRWTWSCAFSYQSQVIDYKLTGREHSVPGRCGRHDYSCHKCPVMQQSHKHFFFFFAAQSQWKAPLLNTPPPLLKPNACHSPCPHQPPAFLHVHKPTHVNTKRKAAHKAMDTWDTQLTINSDLFMSDRSHEVVKQSPAYACFGFYAN